MPAKKTKLETSATLTEDLMSIVGKPLTDKQVKAVLTGAGLPIGEREQAAPTLGVTYSGEIFDIGGKRRRGVHNVRFDGQRVTRYIGGGKVKFAAYKGPPPYGLAFGEPKATVRKKVGKPTTVWEDGEEWVIAKQERRLLAEYTKGKLSALTWAVPREATQ